MRVVDAGEGEGDGGGGSEGDGEVWPYPNSQGTLRLKGVLCAALLMFDDRDILIHQQYIDVGKQHPPHTI